jgi:DNA-binding MarR family transcriptional regulator
MSRENRKALLESLTTEVRRFIAQVILFNEKVAAELELNGTDLQSLHLLVLQGWATPGQLAEWAAVTTGGMTVVLDRLERAGYVTREPNPRDRRSSIVRPVPAKLRKLEAIYRSKGEGLASALSSYNQRELRLLLDFFQKTSRGSPPDAPTPP